jgi:hypothetical protein
MHEMEPSSKAEEGIYVNRKFAFAVLAHLLWILASCSDKPNEPVDQPEPYYKLVYSYVAPEFSILTLNSETGEVLDSVWYPEIPYWDMVFSRDGQRAYYSGRDGIWIEDAATGDTIAMNPEGQGGGLELSPDEDYLVSVGSRRFVLYSVPGLTTIYEDSATSVLTAFHPWRDILYFTKGDGSIIYDSDTLYVLDYAASPPSVDAVALKDSLDQLVPLGPMVVSGDGRWLLNFSYNWLFLTELDSLKVRHVYKSLHFSDANYKGISLHPDGNGAFLTYADPFYKPDVGGLDLFDFQTQSLENFIAHVTIPGTGKYFRPWKLMFTPDGKEMLGVNYQQAFGDYDLFKIELATGDLSLLAPNRGARGEYPQVFRLDPKPYYE